MRADLGVAQIRDNVKETRLRWFGHVKRSDGEEKPWATKNKMERISVKGSERKEAEGGRCNRR